VTEPEWLTCEDPHAMLEFIRLRHEMTARRWRLFAIACCHRLRSLELARVSLDALTVAENHVEGTADENQLSEAYDLAYDLAGAYQHGSGPPVTSGWVALALCYAAHRDESADDVAHFARRALASESEALLQTSFLRDIFGNPFRSVMFSPNWRTDTVVALALEMYESRDFSAMPIIADAIQDAGCFDDDILNHCRSTGPHVRGCWVVDLVLGKE
jgi:hypothetical protein